MARERMQDQGDEDTHRHVPKNPLRADKKPESLRWTQISVPERGPGDPTAVNACGRLRSAVPALSMTAMLR